MDLAQGPFLVPPVPSGGPLAMSISVTTGVAPPSPHPSVCPSRRPVDPMALCPCVSAPRRARGCVPPLSPCPPPSLPLPGPSSPSSPPPHPAESLVPSPRPGPPPRPGQGDGAQPPPAPRRAGGGGRASGRTGGAAAPLALDLLAGQVSGARGVAGGSTAAQLGERGRTPKSGCGEHLCSSSVSLVGQIGEREISLVLPVGKLPV